jgi:GNAT superfamily N-acetyltransferase
VSFSVFTHAERPDLAEQAAGLGDEFWPEYNRHGDVTNAHWHEMRTRFPELQFTLVDDETGELAAEGHTLAIPWDGTVDGLPRGFDGIFEPGLSDAPKQALCAMAAEIRPAYQGRGLAVRVLESMKEVAAREGLADLLAAVRPSRKHDYPLAPIGEYMRWTRADGQALDPWLRVHLRIGGEILRAEPESLRITGTVAEWEEWTGLAFPASGDYVFPDGLAVVTIDREADTGSYWEPNVWIRHRV